MSFSRLDFGEERELAKAVLMDFDGGFSLLSCSCFLLLVDLVCCNVLLLRLLLVAFGSTDDGRTHKTIFRFGVAHAVACPFAFCSNKIPLVALRSSGDCNWVEHGLGVVRSHFSSINLEFFGVNAGVDRAALEHGVGVLTSNNSLGDLWVEFLLLDIVGVSDSASFTTTDDGETGDAARLILLN